MQDPLERLLHTDWRLNILVLATSGFNSMISQLEPIHIWVSNGTYF